MHQGMAFKNKNFKYHQYQVICFRIFIGGISSQALNDMIQYFYTGILKINQDNVYDLLEGADILLLEQVTCLIIADFVLDIF